MIDTSGNMPTLDKEFRKAFVELVQAIEPERINAIYVYPTSLEFQFLWHVGKWVLDEETRSKVIPIFYYR